MPHDYLATQDLDNELGFGWPSSVNYSQLYNSQNPDSPIPYSSSRTANPYAPGQFNRVTTARAEAARQNQARLFTPPRAPGANQGGYAKPNFSSYVNPTAVSAIVAAQNGGRNYAQPSMIKGNGYSAQPRDMADYSQNGKTQEELYPQGQAAKYGSFYSGGKWNAYGAPNAKMDYLG